ncbi:helix-turn-helix domain-containing protein, partial [Paraburkholderia sp.]|uniref:helix-turn-helix domain-containing protein n=1 Tax=Paraburkholderia sp. TaxID=1926495 RepID=UPI003D6DCAD6
MDTDPTFGVFFMAKYSEQLKLKVVKQYLGGAGGTRALAERHGMSRSVVQRWVMAYEQHGHNGLRKKWERQYHVGGIDALTPRPRGRRPKTMTRPDPDKPTEVSAPDE